MPCGGHARRRFFNLNAEAMSELVVKLNIDSVPSGIVPGAGEDGMA
jgi:hypothetical protein